MLSWEEIMPANRCVSYIFGLLALLASTAAFCDPVLIRTAFVVPVLNWAPMAVLTVGGGPCGLMLANELGQRGITAILVDQKPTTTFNPQAKADTEPGSCTMNRENRYE